MIQLTDEQQERTQRLVDQLSKPDFVCGCTERFCIHWQVYAVKVLSPLLDSDSQADEQIMPRTVQETAENIASIAIGKISPAAYKALVEMIGTAIESRATWMRDKCAETVKAMQAVIRQKNRDRDESNRLDAYRINLLDEVIAQLSSLTLDELEPEKS